MTICTCIHTYIHTFITSKTDQHEGLNLWCKQSLHICQSQTLLTAELVNSEHLNEVTELLGTAEVAMYKMNLKCTTSY